MRKMFYEIKVFDKDLLKLNVLLVKDVVEFVKVVKKEWVKEK